jgi:multiple sugar transport system ATP-binding protein
MAEVILKNLKKAYDKSKTNVIDGINLEIKDKEFLVLVGASGCGKSTILRMIAGLEEITDGEIYIGDKKVNNVPPKDRDIAFVFQSYALYPHMTVYENIAFGLKMRKYKKNLIDKKVHEAAEILNLEDLLDRKPKQLSGGQRQRVALGRAIVREPKVFLMDEPLSNLDAKLRVQMRSEIKKLHEKLQTTFIYVTHDQTEALTMGDRIVVLDKGVIQQIDTPDNIYHSPKNTFVAGFVGSPPMNFIEADVKGERLTFAGIPISLSPEQLNDIGSRYKVTVGIRPENMTKENGQIRISVNVDMSEMLGSEKIAYFYIGDKKCSAKLPPTYNVDKTIVLNIDIADIFIFDSSTGERIY